MIVLLVSLVKSYLEKRWEVEVIYFLIHGAKVGFNFEIRIFNFGFFHHSLSFWSGSEESSESERFNISASLTHPDLLRSSTLSPAARERG